MGLRKDIKRVLVIGSGPIVIGQAAEFDYAGTQVCETLKKEGLFVILVNSNPATIMTDKNMADKVYIEPLNLPVLRKIIKKEKPDSILSTLGGQTALTLCMSLAKEGFLEENSVKLLGANPEIIDRAEDRKLFKEMLEKINQPVIPSKIANTVEEAVKCGEEIGYPVIIRPAYTLGGTGGGTAKNSLDMKKIASNGINLSPINQVLIEKSVAGWKEIEFEVIRDSKSNAITVCSMENLDPVGVHTGDSIVIAPAVTLADKEYQMLRKAAIDIVEELKIEGGCNCQFALNPENFEYGVIEVNPRVSRSSALASKATGYPIAKVASKIAVGYTLDEIVNEVTKKTYACFEPVIDYVVVKFPRWPFDKFVYAKRDLLTQMKATGEVMAIAPYFEQALMKAVRSIELGLESLNLEKLKKLTDEEVKEALYTCDDERIFVVYEALKRGILVSEIHDITMIDKWFIWKMKNLVDMEEELKVKELTKDLYMKAKNMGFLDKTIREISSQEIPEKVYASYKMVDTCAGEFEADTPYFYSTFDKENEAKEFIEKKDTGKKKILVLGSGPIRIGQGIEFDYCSVHCVNALKKCGYEAIIVNNNPETVSTDFDISDRLYFEPLTPEDVEAVIETEKPWGVIVQFGGQTSIKLINFLMEKNIRILGTTGDSIDEAEDRERFDKLLEKCQIPRPSGRMAMTVDEAVKEAEELKYPVLLRPSYVLGGKNMIIAYEKEDVIEYMNIITETKLKNPVLIDKYLMGREIEVDAVCDGEDVLIPGIMEHVERAGVHSGDSIAFYPSINLRYDVKTKVIEYTTRLAKALKVKGLVNIQFVYFEKELYVIEVNPRSSRTVPYITKVTNVPIVELGTRVMLGEKLKDMGYKSGLIPESEYYAVKVPVFSFPKLEDLDNQLGPEMKSTGEVMGVSKDFDTALFKGLVAAGYDFTKEKDTVLFTVKEKDKPEIVDIARKFLVAGYYLKATRGTGIYLRERGIEVDIINKEDGPSPNTKDLFESGRCDIVISTSKIGRKPTKGSVRMRRQAIERNIPCITSIDTANAIANCILMRKKIEDCDMIDIVEI